MPERRHYLYPNRNRRSRRGAATLWIILWTPPILCLLGVVVESGHLWLGRVELTNALEAAALAAVDSDGGLARAKTLFEANTVCGQTLDADDIDVTITGTVATDDLRAEVAGAVEVSSLIGKLCGVSLGPFNVKGQTSAVFQHGQPKLAG